MEVPITHSGGGPHLDQTENYERTGGGVSFVYVVGPMFVCTSRKVNEMTKIKLNNNRNSAISLLKSTQTVIVDTKLNRVQSKYGLYLLNRKSMNDVSGSNYISLLLMSMLR